MFIKLFRVATKIAKKEGASLYTVSNEGHIFFFKTKPDGLYRKSIHVNPSQSGGRYAIGRWRRAESYPVGLKPRRVV